MKLSTKLTVLFVLLTTIPLAIVGYLAYANGRWTIEKETINRLISTTILKQDEFERWLEGNEQHLRELAQRPLLRKYAALLASRDPSTGSGRGPADQKYRAAQRSLHEEHLSSHLEELKGFLDLSLLRGGDGLILVSTDERREGKYRESEPYFVEGKSRTYVQNAYYSLSLGEAAMTASTPVKDQDGNLIAVLAGHLNLAEMSQIIMQRSSQSATEGTYLVNRFNFFITEPRFEKGYALKKALHTEGVKACLAGKDGVGFYADYRGVPVIGTYRWMPKQELCILTEVNQAEAYEPIVALRNVVLGISAGMVLIVALLALFFARTITRPVHQLVQGARSIGRGDLNYRIEVGTRDEIGQLGGAFNEMAAELHQSQQALQESEAKYRNLTDSLDEVIYRADPETFVCTYVNPAVERIYGYTVEEWLGDPTLWESTIHPEDKERVLAKFTEAQRKMESRVIEYRIIRKDKMVRWVIDHASWEKDQQGNVVSLNGAMYDITERKQAEVALQEYSERLEEIVEERTKELRDTQEQLVRREKLAILGQLAGGVAHELRNPLSVMSNAIYYLRSINTNADETTREYLERISSAVGNAEGIVSDLLDFSRTRSLEREEVTASELVARVLQERPPPEKVKVTTGIPPELPPAFVDPRQIGQVLGNLVANACQAMPEGGNLTISAQADKEKVSLSITDTGCGISKENMEKIFEPLFTTKARGIGLGLAVSRNLVELNGGSIEVESEAGKGSTFTVALPIKEALS